MANKLTVLVDLNVVLDVLQNRQPFYDESARVLDSAARQEVTGLLAAHSVTTLFYVLNRFRNREIATAAITGLLDAFSIATVEDAVQMAAAVFADADYLITRNPRDFQEGIVPIVQPGAFLALLS
jgi:predicted nucleic acid-binding protein